MATSKFLFLIKESAIIKSIYINNGNKNMQFINASKIKKKLPAKNTAGSK